jgi:hypothetical protein
MAVVAFALAQIALALAATSAALSASHAAILPDRGRLARKRYQVVARFLLNAGGTPAIQNPSFGTH